MTVIKTRQIDGALQSKGFVRSEKDHHYYSLYVDGKKTQVWTKISHGGAECGDTLIGLMAKQAKIAKKEFVQLVECTLSGDEYVARLVARGIIRT